MQSFESIYFIYDRRNVCKVLNLYFIYDCRNVCKVLNLYFIYDCRNVCKVFLQGATTAPPANNPISTSTITSSTSSTKKVRSKKREKNLLLGVYKYFPELKYSNSFIGVLGHLIKIYLIAIAICNKNTHKKQLLFASVCSHRLKLRTHRMWLLQIHVVAAYFGRSAYLVSQKLVQSIYFFE